PPPGELENRKTRWTSYRTSSHTPAVRADSFPRPDPKAVPGARHRGCPYEFRTTAKRWPRAGARGPGQAAAPASVGPCCAGGPGHGRARHGDRGGPAHTGRLAVGHRWLEPPLVRGRDRLRGHLAARLRVQPAAAA